MKKLLAMILCVAMVLSIAPAAFAAGTTGGIASDYDDDRLPEYVDTSVAKKTITDLGKDMKAMYYAIAADEAVFGTAKGIYSMTDSLAKELLKDIDKYETPFGDIYQEDLIDNVRKGLNHVIGNEIANYLNDRVGTFTNGAGYVQPDKYMNVFVKAVNNALTSNKAQKNIQAIVYGLAALNLQKTVNDRADDLYDDIIDWDHWKEFHWTTDEDGNAINVTEPDLYGYAWSWLPTEGETNTVLVPTGSEQTINFLIPSGYTGDAALAAEILSGLLND
jgi:nitrogenase molybdenum-iron protein alpha/beta subunit